MTFWTLAVIGLAGCIGPLLAMPARWHLPVVLGELLAGLLLGPTLAGALHSSDPTFTFLADLGFALIMFVAGSHVPVRDARLRSALRDGVLRAVAVGVVAVFLGIAVSSIFDTGHAALYAVLIASSSAALVLPITDSLRLQGPDVLKTLGQVAVADTVCIVALPLAIDPARAGRAALGSLAVLACAAVLFVVLRDFERRGWRKRLHKVSEARRFALELRINLILLFALAALAVHTHVSIMLAGFSFGLAVAGVGEPRRLAKQLFAVTEGFLGPLFFIWLGASINLRDLGDHPSFIALGVALGLAAVLAHVVLRLVGQPLPLALLAAAQLGVPVAAATVGTQLHILRPGESAALLLGALTTIAFATVGAALAARSAPAVKTADRPA
jgi:Kef-type K+ transport system membrane component KefB